jgi:hypothetical protein
LLAQARQEAERQKREGAGTLEKSEEELKAEAELKARADKLASEPVKDGSAGKAQAKTGKKGTLQQDDEEEDIELD